MEETNPKLMACQDCGAMISKRAAICPKCGGPNDACVTKTSCKKSAPAQIETQCPKCNTIVNRFATACPKCGEKLNPTAVSADEIKAQIPMELNDSDLHSIAIARGKNMAFIVLYLVSFLFFLGLYAYYGDFPESQVKVFSFALLFLCVLSCFITFFTVKTSICLKKIWCYVVGVLCINPFLTFLAIVILDQFSFAVMKKHAKKAGIKPLDYKQEKYSCAAEATSGLQLYSPESAITWSSFLTPVFGTYLLRKNYLALGETEKGKQSLYWLIGLIVVYLPAVFFLIYWQEEPYISSYLSLHALFSIIWYVFYALPHMQLLNRFNIKYTPKAMRNELIAGIIPACILIYIPIIFIVLRIIFVTTVLTHARY